MKRKIVIASLFLLAYLGFLLAQLPASLVVRHLPLPPIWCGWRGERHPLERSGRSGAICQRVPTQLRWDLDGWSLLRLAPEGVGALWRAQRTQRAGDPGLERCCFRARHHPQCAGPWVLERVPMRPPSR